ncbi:hemolysin III [Saccharicrinis carchari]|uniref:Hemolysin III n=1 Tax=Saccharicrinis carchari TaxID=1168039 RepID=A0A521CHZ0_SACCC|nr:hemolysin III family protein [Saccharicrinis carchari]SMO59066.1 hemolysin III [Saccharicrinis carchari]
MSDTTKSYPLNTYSKREEKLNIITHAIGVICAVPAFILMLIKIWPSNNVSLVFSVTIYGFSLITLYIASTLFHKATQAQLRHRLNIFDHAAIYFLIAGTYTPYALITLNGETGWIVMAVIWTIALIGIILKFFFTGKYRLLSTIMYVAMGWVVVFAIKPLYNNLDFAGFIWLMVGGLAYTLGAVLYALKNIPFNHAIFHVFVLMGSASHFISIYKYVLV